LIAVRHHISVRRSLLVSLACAVLCLGSTGTASGAIVYVAGDIACDPTDSALNTNGPGLGSATRCAQMRTSNLMIDQPADAVIALGDLQYNSGTLANFNAVYDPSWGRLKFITRPVIGNHEGILATSGAGYCSYFGSAAHCNASGRQGGAAFYSFDVGAWHVVVLNSNCTAAGGCDVNSPQYRWLANDLETKSEPCTMAVWHHPRWSSGDDGSNAFMHPIWQLFHASGGDLVLAGHSHDYERFAPLDGDGVVNATTGTRSFVVGTGGAFFTGLSAVATGSQVWQNTTFGVLKLVLNATSYSWTFVPEAGGTFTDSGSQACRTGKGSDTTPPSVPTGLAVTNATANQVDLKWNAATDNVGVTLYRVVRDGILAGTTNGGLTFSDRAALPSTNYSYTVEAADAVGNTSDPSAAVAVTTPPFGGSVTTFPATAAPTADNEQRRDALRHAVTLGGKKTQRVRKSISLVVRAISEDLWVSLSGTVSVPGAPKVYKLNGVKNRFVARGSKVTLKVKVPKKGLAAIKRALRRHKKVKATLRVRVRDAAGNVVVKTRTIRLKRARAQT
jgi:hypothetical protein